MSCWRVVGARSQLGLAEEEVVGTAIVGREREVALLRDAFERVRRDERPQLITLVGVPGIGKSRLVQELRAFVDADPELITWRRGRSLPYGEGVAYWALGEIVKAQAGILESDGASVAGEKLERAVQDLVSDAVEAVWVERHMRPLVGIGSGDGQPARAEAFAARRRFLEALAETGPAVLVFEDVHWADDDLLDFVDEITDKLDSVPLLLICTARPELLARRPAWGGGKLNAATLSLAPLSDDETRRLLHGLLDRSVIPADTQTAIVQRAEGVPLFAEELARMLSEGEAPTRLPETLQGLVTARVDGLAPAEKALLQDASVLGKVFWTDALVALSSLDGDDLEERLRALERREFVRRERRSAVEGARQYTFLHAVVRDAAYGQIPRAARSAKHRATAEWITTLPADRSEDRAETLAHHLEAAISYGAAAGIDVSDLTVKAVRALRDAGDRAWSLNALGRAERFYRRALELGGDSDPDPELIYLAARAQYWSAGSGAVDDAAFEAAIDALVEAGKTELAALGCVVLARARWNKQIPPAALYDRAEALVRDLPASTARAEVLSTVGAYAAINGNGERGLELTEQAVADARAVGDVEMEAHALNSLGVAQDAACRYNEALASTGRALALALDAGSYEVSRCLTNLATFEFGLGLLEQSSTHVREGLALARRSEARAYEDWLAREEVIAAFYLGRWQEAVDGIEKLCAFGSEDAHLMDIALAPAHAAIVHDRNGVLLEDELTWGVERARAIGDPQLLHPALAESALVYALAGRHEAARALLNELTATAVGRRGMFQAAALSAALAWVVVGAALPPAVTLGPGRWNDAARLIREGELTAAADVLAEIGARGHEAWARILAAQQLTARQPEEARAQLEQATAFFRDADASAALARAHVLTDAVRSAAS